MKLLEHATHLGEVAPEHGCVATVPAMKLVAATSSSSFALTEYNNIKNFTYNLQLISIFEDEKKN
jgi:hypothetical protein